MSGYGEISFYRLGTVGKGFAKVDRTIEGATFRLMRPAGYRSWWVHYEQGKIGGRTLLVCQCYLQAGTDWLRHGDTTDLIECLATSDDNPGRIENPGIFTGMGWPVVVFGFCSSKQLFLLLILLLGTLGWFRQLELQDAQDVTDDCGRKRFNSYTLRGKRWVAAIA